MGIGDNMGLFGCKCKRKEKEKEEKILTIEKEFELGFSVIKITFKDGRTFRTVLYGKAFQHYGDSVIAHTGNFKAEQLLAGLNANPTTFVDDELAPTESVVGEVIAAKIVGGGQYGVKLSVKYIEGKQLPSLFLDDQESKALDYLD